MTGPLSAASAQRGRLRVLLVDDEPELRAELTDTIAREGYEVLGASGVAEARRALAEHSDIGVMICDVRMPDGDGVELTREVLRGRPEHRALEAILMTGHATLESALAAVSTGAREMLRKPVRAADLIGALSPAMARAMGRRAIGEEHAASRAPGMSRQVDEILTQSGVSGLAALSHELRTPLVPIVGYAELLESIGETPQTRQFGGEIARSAQTLLSTIDAMIMMTQLQAGSRTLAAVPCQARSLLQAVLRDEAGGLTARGSTADAEADSELMLAADPGLMTAALRVLVAAAQLFAPRGAHLRLRAVLEPSGVLLVTEALATRHETWARPALAPLQDAAARVAQSLPVSIQFCARVIEMHGGTLRMLHGSAPLFTALVQLPAASA